MRILLFCNDLMPVGELPTSGGGLRCYQLYQGLKSHGIEVIPSMPGFTFLVEKFADKIPQPFKSLLWRYETQEKIISQTKPDCILYSSNWDHYALRHKPKQPLIIDLHGSRLIETAMWGNPVSAERKVKVFSHADCLLSAGKNQRDYFYGWLAQAGRFPTEEHFIRYIPVALDPELPEVKRTLEEPTIVSGGGWFPWQDQSLAIQELSKEVERREFGKLVIFGTPHSVNPRSKEEARILKIFNDVKLAAETSNRIEVRGYVSRPELLDFYAQAHCALESMVYNLERELAFTTRTVEYLWCGLPVLYNDFGELSGHIAEYNAGWCVDPSNKQSLNEAIDSILSHPELLQLKALNAQKLVRDRFTWDKAVLPLVEFLQRPKRLSRGEAATESLLSQPTFLNPPGKKVEMIINHDNPFVWQRFIVPTERLSGLELEVFQKEAGGVKVLILEVQNQDRNRRRLRTVSGHRLPADGRLRIDFRPWWLPRGGEILELVIRVDFETSDACLGVIGLSPPVFPLLSDAQKEVVGEEVAVSLNFIPIEQSRLFQYQALAGRAISMLKQGEWRRLYRALKRRLAPVA